MTNTRLEKMARAMAYKWFIGDPEPDVAAAMASEDVAEWVPIARAALLAIREPSQTMIYAGYQTDVLLCRADAAQVFTAMIDAILSEGEA